MSDFLLNGNWMILPTWTGLILPGQPTQGEPIDEKSWYQKLKSLIYKTIQTLNSVLYRSPFGCNYSLHSSWLSLNKLCTLGFGQLVLLFLADPLKLHHTGWDVSVMPSTGLCTDVLQGLSLGLLTGPLKDRQGLVPKAIPAMSWLCA